MSEPAVDIAAWIAEAQSDRATHLERQATEIVLHAVASMPEIGSHFFLKGGILMAIAYHSPRNTADIDFSTDLPPEPHLPGLIRERLGTELQRARARLGYANLLLQVQSIKERPRRFGSPETSFPALDLRVGYTQHGRGEERLARGMAPQAVHIEISFNEPLPATELLMLKLNSAGLPAYTLTDLIAEKLRALLQQLSRNPQREQARYRRQDVYDIAHLLKHFPPDAARRAAILTSFRIKCAARGITPDSASFDNPLVAERARAEWASLRQDLGLLPDFDECFPLVQGLYRSLPW
jgi:hypothetical protein